MTDLRGLPDAMSWRGLFASTMVSGASGTAAAKTSKSALENADYLSTFHQHALEFIAVTSPYLTFIALAANGGYAVFKAYQTFMASQRRKRAK